jgi:hypothetical protein
MSGTGVWYIAGPGGIDAGYLVAAPAGIPAIMGTAGGAAMYKDADARRSGAAAVDDGGRQTPQFELVQLLKMMAPFSLRWRMIRRPSIGREASQAREE